VVAVPKRELIGRLYYIHPNSIGEIFPKTLAIVFLLYFTVALSFYGRYGHWSSAVIGGGGDTWSFIWYLNWWPWAILHGRDPLYSHMVYAPSGYSLAWGTSVPTASLLALPVTLTAGAAVSFNLLSDCLETHG
jgi:hypothetical protein